MYRILIADDEMIIRTQLAEAFDWPAYGMEVVGLAKNGPEALELVNILQPDICLLDINMPVINGLELIEMINAKNKDVVTVVITGYDEFQYAQRALKLGVFDFVLKPIEEEDFVTLLLKIKVKLDQMAADRYQEMLVRTMMSENKDSLVNDFMIRWVRGDKSQQEANQHFEYFHIEIPKTPGLVLIKINTPVGIVENDEAKTRQITLCRKAVEAYFANIPHLLIELKMDCLLVLVPTGESQVWNNLDRNLEKRIEDSTGIQVKIAKLPAPKGIESIPETFIAMEKQLKTESGYLPFVKMIKKYVEKNYEDSQLRLQDIADKNQVSISYFSKIFKQETGVSFIDYLIKFRILKSLELLEQSDYKISTISEMVGYSSQHYYCEAFKKVMGLSPTDYRKHGTLKTVEANDGTKI